MLTERKGTATAGLDGTHHGAHAVLMQRLPHRNDRAGRPPAIERGQDRYRD
jgi:hypothetical protein